MKITVSDLVCPKCGSPEMHPNGKWLLIRGYKIQHEGSHWWSQCLVCAGYYDKNLVPIPDAENRREVWGNKGWF
jgi:hypothetical protein